jgi:putative hydrolase of the HAD superfamily
MPKAIIFDCFGVLVGRGFDETYRVAGGDPVKDKDFIADLLGRANLGLISQQDFHDEITERLNISLNKYYTAVRSAEQPHFELLEYIEELHKHYKTAVLSNANVGVVERKIGESWLKRCFDVSIISAEVGVMKPEPRIYEMAAEKLGVVVDECVFIDDRKVYCEAAQQVGMQAILYKNLVQLKHDLEELLKP